MRAYKNKCRHRWYHFNLILFIINLVAINLPINANAQDLELSDMTISTNETFSAENSITAGPNFTITGTGAATFKTGNTIVLKPGIVVIENGQFFGLTGVATSLNQDMDTQLPVEFSIGQNYPNPFNPSTTIEYSVAKRTRVKIDVFNITGQHIITLLDEEQQAGWNNIQWNGKNQFGNEVVSGMYFYRIMAESFNQTRKMILMR